MKIKDAQCKSYSKDQHTILHTRKGANSANKYKSVTAFFSFWLQTIVASKFAVYIFIEIDEPTEQAIVRE